MHGLWLSITLLAVMSADASGAAYDSPTTGFATQYGGRQDRSDPNTPIYGLIDGACGYGAIPRTSWPYWQVAALGFSNSVSASGSPQKWGCGACIQVTCTGSGCTSKAPFVVLVTDTCKACAANQININALTYEKYISATNGQMAISWQKVPCAPTGNIVARVTAASGSYLRLVLTQVGGSDGVKSVEVSKSGSGSWIKMDSAWGANWQTSSAPAPPLDLRITPNDGSAPLVATGAITAAAPGDYDTGVQLGFPAAAAANATAAAPDAAGNATAPLLGPPVGPQQIPTVAAANATAAPVNATAAPVNATAAPVKVPAAAAAPVAAANGTVVPVVAAVPAAPAAANFTTLTFPASGAAQTPQAAKPASAGQPVSQPPAVLAAAVPTAAVAVAAVPTKAAVPAASTPASGAVSAFSTPAVAPRVQATPPATVPAPQQATPAAAPVLATPVAAPATPPVTVPAPVQATPPSTPAAVPSSAAAEAPAASSSTPASPPQAAAISTGSAPAPVAQASGNANQPFSLNFDRTAANVTGGNAAAAPSIDSAVENILNPKVTYNSGGRKLS
ncbi:hypothetical protein COCSUDRAFT_46828 [Coccomyxa subellipsoidea C-169]|uniref:Expansin-like EG45 domain-containing protein n=1 Tax=Coccomyxa subellipsoidea (strain C-169) TaxID=574566 RepID=I0Z1H6_COCSC|nr:hypothetical protein COCSUDRAFT_46828 [Coccomyxa subellipsoidea C-169]EIE24495.1 hypothetical protein COCSUDRAFT_46828 [Coccomyxa subellipsoidea C-169]|eukprot:XP_005649039.1 hypothetical protein COCSUDRAFT_46828 [Coccomyxa subellipsoidea C-169]